MICKKCGIENDKKQKVCSCGAKLSKPIYKRVWFIVLIAIVVIGVIGSTLGNGEYNGLNNMASDNHYTIIVDEVTIAAENVFIVEYISELTQNHLTEEQRVNHREHLEYMYDYHMNTLVLFIPATVTIREATGERMIRWTPSGTQSSFEADTLNSKKLHAFAVLDSDTTIKAYFAFVWEGYGEYRLELRGNETIAEIVFNITSENVTYR